MQERPATPQGRAGSDRTTANSPSTTSTRWIFSYAIVSSIVTPFFVVDVMTALGGFGTVLLACTWLLAGAIGLWIILDLPFAIVRALRNRDSWLRIPGIVVLATALFLPPVILYAFPDLPHHSFLWRHESGFLRAIERGDRRSDQRHYAHGSEFRFEWPAIGSSYYVVVHEPDRPPESQPLGRDTDRYPRRRITDRHLWGPWYVVID